MKKILLLLGLVFVAAGLFSDQEIDDAIILHPKLSYRNNDEELTFKDYHVFGDKVRSNGEIKTFNDTKYVFTEKDGESYYTYFYFVVQKSVEGVILEESFIYKTNDFSTVTEEKINKLTFVAVDKDTISHDLVKISYLTKSDKGWLISKGWVKKTVISTDRDNWGTGIKYFLATQDEDELLKKKRLESVLKLHKNTLFKDLISKMIEEDHLRINSQEYVLDSNFAGTLETLLNPYYGKIYSEPSLESEILSEGEFKIALDKRLLDPVKDNGINKYWYLVITNEVNGWILK